MIVFLDTSALVKLYIVETGSQALLSRIEKAEGFAVFDPEKGSGRDP